LDNSLIFSNFNDLPQSKEVMYTSEYPNIKSIIINTLEGSRFSNLKQARKQFIIILLMSYLSIKGKINFLQLSRFSRYCEQYFRIHFENIFAFQDFNLSLIGMQKIKESIIAFDPSYIPKSGKATFGVNRYWSGCAKQTKWGLDICGFAVVDVVRKTAFHLNAVQTPVLENISLLDYYCRLLKENVMYFKELSSYLVADAYFSKKEVVKTILSLGLHFISRLRDDAAMRYLYDGKQTGKPGANKKYDGKVDPKNPNMHYFKKIYSTKEMEIYSAIVYHNTFERKINLAMAVFYKNGKEIARKLYFSTDLEMDGIKIVQYYRSRFQIEFLYRDAKQHCGLNNCQARSQNKLYNHFNASLTAVNLAKAEHLANKKNRDKPFSMANYKTMYHNQLLLNLFFQMFGLDPNTKKNKDICNKLKTYGCIAA
jgi:hypothetical protein